MNIKKIYRELNLQKELLKKINTYEDIIKLQAILENLSEEIFFVLNGKEIFGNQKGETKKIIGSFNWRNGVRKDGENIELNVGGLRSLYTDISLYSIYLCTNFDCIYDIQKDIYKGNMDSGRFYFFIDGSMIEYAQWQKIMHLSKKIEIHLLFVQDMWSQRDLIKWKQGEPLYFFILEMHYFNVEIWKLVDTNKKNISLKVLLTILQETGITFAINIADLIKRLDEDKNIAKISKNRHEIFAHADVKKNITSEGNGGYTKTFNDYSPFIKGALSEIEKIFNEIKPLVGLPYSGGAHPQEMMIITIDNE